MKLNNIQQEYINKKLIKLSKSTFRNSFNLKQKDINYINDKGLDVIEEHAYKFIRERLLKVTIKDGKQTPMKGHPVFIAQHATATCCRGCLKKWHNIDNNRDLEEREINFIVALIMEWIKTNYLKKENERL